MTGKATKPKKGVQHNKNKVIQILKILAQTYPDAKCTLNHKNAFQLLIATILSAQCTDVRVNVVTRSLFTKYRSARALAKAFPEEIEKEIRSTGFFRSKTKSIMGASQALISNHRSQVPRTMEELTILPGVARKTANVVLGTGFGIARGIVVDTHVGRIAQRLGLSSHQDPKKIERDLMEVLPQESWIVFAHRVIYHGRRLCMARNPACGKCPLFDVCEYPERFARK